ncbi:uncharacterized protein CC84DRAFT_1256883 [Paraphaeosphaeria sporulosa]|uniref:Prion-inhibition and propagation HeLo domain-containing protein n=1 Tax=Paraphaeosphaeria sporulosa TaxID=1460663 RepID=A0A177CK82_9PLEO|nr:uncharacterized protein CC84DRAFT_1256883 [Paraphaeosphaeria sporulosa]OAG07925.1 hypothetical protein CC84DRAFT_1256883 [Paraphaeosphaeria sporulosa]
MAELALAAVSLTFQVFSGCIQGYELITDAKDMPSDCQYLRVRLKTEEYRLLDWADVVRLDETDDSLLISNSSKGLLLDVLDQQRRLLHQFGRLDEKYKKLSRPLLVDYVEEHGRLPEPPAYAPSGDSPTVTRVDSDFRTRFPQSQVLLKKSVDWAKKSAEVPRKLKWAVFDKTKMEALVQKLVGFNDFMRDMLNSAQLESLVIKQTRTEFQIMQLNNSIQSLVQIFESTALVQTKRGRRRSRHVTNPVRAYMQSQGLDDPDDYYAETPKPGLQSLAALAQFKALNSAIQDPDVFTDEFTSSIALSHSASETLNVELARAHLSILPTASPDQPHESHREEAFYQPPHTRKTSVWIEWKTYEPPPFHPTGPDPKILERVKALAALLKENNRTNQFRAPHCLGYFQDVDPDTGEDHCRFGLVFEKPGSAHPSTRPISLHALLTRRDMDTPSLTARIALMRLLSEAVERLHAVNWLHKGLRSSAILFFSDCGPGEVDFNDPYISGFDYSRPAMNDDLTEKPPENAAADVYRHPRVQGSGLREPSSPNSSSSYKKSYDIYALGIVLLEIAYWAPIDAILGIPDLERAKPSVVFGVRKRLLDDKEPFLRHVRSHLGDTVEGVVRACLVGASAFGVGEGRDEREEGVGAELQRGFYERVVREFGGMRL